MVFTLTGAVRTLAVAALAASLATPIPAAMAQDGGAPEEITIGAIIYARDSQFWQQVERGMSDAAAEHNVDLIVGLNRRQLATEAQVVEDFVTRQVDAIILPPLDSDASQAALSRAKRSGITIVDYDTRLTDRELSSHTIGVDSIELAATVGREMGEVVAEAGDGATVALITLPPTNPNMQPRRTGLVQGLDETASDYTIAAEVAAATPEQGANAVETILQANPNVTAIWASNSGSITGAATAAGRTDTDAKLFGIDMSRELADMLLDPESPLVAVSDQQPYRVGYLVVETAAKAVRGEDVPRDVSVPVKLYSKDDPEAVKKYLDLLDSLQ